MSDLDKTMEQRKAVLPLFEQQSQQLQKLFVKQDERVKKFEEKTTELLAKVQLLAETIQQDRLEEKRVKVTNHPTAIRVENPVTEVKVKNPVTEVSVKDGLKNHHLEKLFSDFGKRLEDDRQKMIESFSKQMTDEIEKTVTTIAKSIQSTKVTPKEYTREAPLPVVMTNQIYAETFTSGGGSRNADDQTWFREQYTYTTVSGNQVVSTIEKWNDKYKLTERYEYDVNANPVVKSRSLEPLTVVGE